MELEDSIIEIEVEEKNTSFMEIFSGTGVGRDGNKFSGYVGGVSAQDPKKKLKVTAEEARRISLTNEEALTLIDMDEVY